MPDAYPPENSLVIYKGRPARVKREADKLEIEIWGGEVARVRVKDVTLLHPGPLRSLAELELAPRFDPSDASLPDDVLTAWEMLAGSTTTLAELAELAYAAFTPASAWAAWLLVSDGLYFHGDVDKVIANTQEEVRQKQAARAADAAEKAAWNAFLGRVRAGQPVLADRPGYAVEDGRYLKEVEALAFGRSERSRVMAALGREESPENAHALLLELGFWDETVNPHPRRLDLPLSAPDLPLPDLADEPRRDLTRLAAFAIDDAATETPDDALSFEPGADGGWAGGRLWVHVADAAALVAPDSPLDLEARGRGATLYLPEVHVHMLPLAATPLLGLGLAEVSPALSFGLDLDAEGRVIGTEIVASWVRVTRVTYEEVEARIADEPFATLHRLAEAYRDQRRARGAVVIDLPEADVRVVEGQVILKPVLPLRSRALVEEAMVMAGEAAARFAIERGIPIPLASQEPPDTEERPETLSGMFALRKTLRRRQYRVSPVSAGEEPAGHAGLGLAAYAQVTSPLRRYLDLVAHQQLRAALGQTTEGSRARQPLSEQQVLERIGAAEAILGSLREAERLSEQHWKLVYLKRQGKWRGDGIVVEQRQPWRLLQGKRNDLVVIPELGLETTVLKDAGAMHLGAEPALDSRVSLSLASVDLPRLDARFRPEM
ncbi:MAG: RNB domain-containing ribonuclease [Chloroflexi bacterium]|nr:RNB domain-containing ribonuclease [Chloroflexota bacterium]